MYLTLRNIIDKRQAEKERMGMTVKTKTYGPIPNVHVNPEYCRAIVNYVTDTNLTCEQLTLSYCCSNALELTFNIQLRVNM